jgi:hypothetical protein
MSKAAGPRSFEHVQELEWEKAALNLFSIVIAYVSRGFLLNVVLGGDLFFGLKLLGPVKRL